MKKIALAIAVVALSLGAATTANAATVTKLTVSANGANESANGAMKGTATGTFTVNESKNTLCSNIKVKGLAGIAAAHIHKGAAGVDGAVVATLNIAKFNHAGTSCVKVAHAIAADIAMNPSGYYFNVHTKLIPGGAIRGQLKVKM